jgi:hypothetical protein
MIDRIHDERSEVRVVKIPKRAVTFRLRLNETTAEYKHRIASKN